MAMADPLIISAPLLIAAVVLAVRFVGCSFHPGQAAVANTHYSDTVLSDPNLVSFWRLNEQSGTTVVDSKDGNQGAYQGAVTLGVPGLVSPDSQDSDNFAAQFDGQTGYVNVQFDANLNPPTFTVEALVQPSGTDPNKHVIVSSDTGYQLALNGSAFEASVAAGGAFQPPVVVDAGAEGGPPYYVAMTCDGMNLQLYVNPAASDGKTNFLNNENTGNGRYNSAQVTYQPATSNELRIGASADAGPPGEFFQGVIQNVAVYNAALGFDEIVNHFWIFATGYSPYLPPPGPGFTGEGTLSVTAAFPANAPATTEYPLAGTYTYDIPYWCTYIDLILLGGGGGGANPLGGVIPGAGGQGGSWTTVTLQRGVGISLAATSIAITVGSGGAVAANGGPTTATANGMSTTAIGGTQGASTNGTTGGSPGNVTYNGTTYTGGAAQTTPGAAGNAPGGGGGGANPLLGAPAGGAGAHGAAWVVARQT
jgi:Concanavalin A-like lectin/glucanases superfamily